MSDNEVEYYSENEYSENDNEMDSNREEGTVKVNYPFKNFDKKYDLVLKMKKYCEDCGISLCEFLTVERLERLD
jgi:hypothetical protein